MRREPRRNTSCITCSVRLGAAFVAASLPTFGIAAADERQEVSAAEMEQAVTDLEDPRFAVRSYAASRLRAWDTAAVESLGELLREGSLESAQVASEILSEIAIRHPPARDRGAYEALKSRARDGIGAAAGLASEAADQVADYRGTMAVDRLRRAGADVGVGPVVMFSTESPSTKRILVDGSFRDTPQHRSWLRWLRDTPLLVVSQREISPELAAALARCPVSRLIVVKCELGGAALSALADSDHIRIAEIRYTAVAEDSMTDWVRRRRLRRLSVMGVGLDAAQIEGLRRADPTLAIEFKRGGFLGVRASNGSVCKLSMVLPGSAAEAAGLRREDIVVRLDGRPVRSFDELRLQIGEMDAGQEAEVMYVRQNNIRKTTIRLGEMD